MNTYTSQYPPHPPQPPSKNENSYEQFPFNTGGGGNSSDYLFMLLFGAGCLHILNLYVRFRFRFVASLFFWVRDKAITYITTNDERHRLA